MNLQLKAAGIASIDVKKLEDAGLCTVESVAFSPRKELLQIKGISDAKVDKIIQAGMSLSSLYSHTLQYCFCCLFVLQYYAISLCLFFSLPASKLVPLGFTSAGQLHAQRLGFIQITSGSRELGKVLEAEYYCTNHHGLQAFLIQC